MTPAQSAGLVARLHATTLSDDDIRAIVAALAALPHMQPAGEAVVWRDSFAKDAGRYAGHFREMARNNPGTMIEGVVSLLDDISLITTQPANPGD